MEGPNTHQPFSVRFAPAEASVADEKTLKKSNKGYIVDSNERKRRNKFLFEGVRLEMMELQKENEYLKSLVREKITPMSLAETILKEAEAPVVDIFLQNSVLLDETDEFDESLDGSLGSYVVAEEEIPNVKSIATSISERSNTTKTTKTSESSELTSEDTPRISAAASVEKGNSNSLGTRKGILRKRVNIDEKDAHKSGSASTKSSVTGTARRKKVLTHKRTDSKRMISYGKKLSNESLETKKSIATKRTIDTGAKSISTRKTTHSTPTLRASGTRRRTIGTNLQKSPSRTTTNVGKIGFRSRSKTDESATRKSSNTTGTNASSGIGRRTRPSSNTTSSTLNQRTTKSDPMRRKPRDTSRPGTSTASRSGLKKKQDPRPHSSPSTKRSEARLKSKQEEGKGKSAPKRTHKQVEIKSPISSIGSDGEDSLRGGSIPRMVDVDIGDFSIEEMDENSSSERNLSRNTTRRIPQRVGSDVVVFHQEVESLAAALGGDLAF